MILYDLARPIFPASLLPTHVLPKLIILFHDFVPWQVIFPLQNLAKLYSATKTHAEYHLL